MRSDGHHRQHHDQRCWRCWGCVVMKITSAAGDAVPESFACDDSCCMTLCIGFSFFWQFYVTVSECTLAPRKVQVFQWTGGCSRWGSNNCLLLAFPLSRFSLWQKMDSRGLLLPLFPWVTHIGLGPWLPLFRAMISVLAVGDAGDT